MKIRVSAYVVFITLLSIASAACLFALARRYVDVEPLYQVSFGVYVSLAIPSLICAGFWVWWRNRFFRVAGCLVALLLLMCCAKFLDNGPVGGDMDFGPSFAATIAAMGCFVISVIALALAAGLSFMSTRSHDKPLQPLSIPHQAQRTAPPEIFCDLNAGATANSYRLTDGSFADLKELGLTPDQAIGMQFSFNGGDDTDANGQPADIMFDGTIVKDDRWGYVAVPDSNGIHWRAKTRT